MIDIKISNFHLDPELCLDIQADDSCGGTVSFVGTVRNETKGKKVLRLEFECYESMAVKEMKKIAEHCVNNLGVKHAVLHHRVGILSPGEAAVVIVVSSPHRDAAFKACEYAINTLKETVPIWKKEIFEDGEQWVSAHP